MLPAGGRIVFIISLSAMAGISCAESVPMAIDAVAAGKVNLKGIVTDIFTLDEIQKAMDHSVNNKADIVKAVVRIGEQ